MGNPDRIRWTHLACSVSQSENRILFILSIVAFSDILFAILRKGNWVVTCNGLASHVAIPLIGSSHRKLWLYRPFGWHLPYWCQAFLVFNCLFMSTAIWRWSCKSCYTSRSCKVQWILSCGHLLFCSMLTHPFLLNIKLSNYFTGCTRLCTRLCATHK